MIHHKDFPFHEPDEESDIVHLSPRGGARLTVFRIFVVALVAMMLVLSAKALFDLGRGDIEEGGIPVIEANPEPYKVKPDDPGGMAIPHIDKEIYDKIKMPIEEPIDFYSEQNGKEDEMDRLFARELKEETDFKINNAPEIVRPQAKTLKLTSGGGLKEVDTKVTADSSNKAKRIDVDKILSRKSENEIWLQLGSFKTEQEATKAWQETREKNSDILSDLMIKVTKSDMKDQGMSYRLQAGSVDGEGKAKELCKKLNTRKQSCFYTVYKTNND